MKIPVQIVPISGDGYRANAFGLSANATTRDEAIQKLKAMIDAQPAGEGETVWLDVEHPEYVYMNLLQKRLQALQEEIDTMKRSQEKPWLAVKGMYKDDPRFDEWQAAIAEYRRAVDADPDAL